MFGPFAVSFLILAAALVIGVIIEFTGDFYRWLFNKLFVKYLQKDPDSCI